jgi:hypothetical protein
MVVSILKRGFSVRGRPPGGELWWRTHRTDGPVDLRTSPTGLCSLTQRYSTRSATIGSTRVARRAGINVATMPASASTADTLTKTIGSSGAIA